MTDDPLGDFDRGIIKDMERDERLRVVPPQNLPVWIFLRFQRVGWFLDRGTSFAKRSESQA